MLHIYVYNVFWHYLEKLDDCTCGENGNIFTVLPSADCSQFTQSTATLPPVVHDCPTGLKFNVDVCVCDFEHEFICPSNCTENDQQPPAGDTQFPGGDDSPQWQVKHHFIHPFCSWYTSIKQFKRIKIKTRSPIKHKHTLPKLNYTTTA